MDIPSSPISSQTELVLPSTSTTPPILRLRLQKKKSPKTVVWSDGTVDNEHMNKKKSKCCCIYKKPLAFGESSSEEEEECEHCFGHPEKRTKSHNKHNPDHPTTSNEYNETDYSSPTDQCDPGGCILNDKKQKGNAE